MSYSSSLTLPDYAVYLRRSEHPTVTQDDWTAQNTYSIEDPIRTLMLRAIFAFDLLHEEDPGSSGDLQTTSSVDGPLMAED
jgi:hypothetical protein